MSILIEQLRKKYSFTEFDNNDGIITYIISNGDEYIGKYVKTLNNDDNSFVLDSQDNVYYTKKYKSNIYIKKSFKLMGCDKSTHLLDNDIPIIDYNTRDLTCIHKYETEKRKYERCPYWYEQKHFKYFKIPTKKKKKKKNTEPKKEKKIKIEPPIKKIEPPIKKIEPPIKKIEPPIKKPIDWHKKMIYNKWTKNIERYIQLNTQIQSSTNMSEINRLIVKINRLFIKHRNETNEHKVEIFLDDSNSTYLDYGYLNF